MLLFYLNWSLGGGDQKMVNVRFPWISSRDSLVFRSLKDFCKCRHYSGPCNEPGFVITTADFLIFLLVFMHRLLLWTLETSSTTSITLPWTTHNIRTSESSPTSGIHSSLFYHINSITNHILNVNAPHMTVDYLMATVMWFLFHQDN